MNSLFSRFSPFSFSLTKITMSVIMTLKICNYNVPSCTQHTFTLCLKKVPTFKLILTDFQNFYTAGKRMKFATKLISQYLPHLRHVITLPWEIKNSNFLHIFSRHGRKCKRDGFLSPLTLIFINKF